MQAFIKDRYEVSLSKDKSIGIRKPPVTCTRQCEKFSRCYSKLLELEWAAVIMMQQTHTKENKSREVGYNCITGAC